MTADAVAPEPRYLHGPGVCGNSPETIDWAGTRVLEMADGTRFGIRSSSLPLLAALEGLYPDLVVGDEGPALYSLHVGTGGRRRAAPLHFLYHGGQVLRGTRDLGRLVRCLVSHASQVLERELAETSVLGTTVVLPDGTVLLAPPELGVMAREVDRLLTSEGVAVADSSWAVLRPRTDGGAGVAVPRPGVGPDPDELDLDALRALGPSVAEPVVGAGERTLGLWYAAVPPAALGPLRRAQAAASTANLLRRPYPGGPATALGTLLDVVGAGGVVGVNWVDSDDLVGQVARAAAAGPA